MIVINTKKEEVFRIVSKIPKTRVITYKRLSEISGIRNPRIIGNYLHSNKDPDLIPCYRVVRSDGRLASGYAYGGKQGQKKRLSDDGIKLKKDRVDLSKYLWTDYDS